MLKNIYALLFAIAIVPLSLVNAQKDASSEIYYGAYVNFTFDIDVNDNTTEQVE